jgi:hypothetical protein
MQNVSMTVSFIESNGYRINHWMYNVPLKIYVMQSALYRNKIQHREFDATNEKY